MFYKVFYSIFLLSFIIDILLRNIEKEYEKQNPVITQQADELIPNENSTKIETEKTIKKSEIPQNNQQSSLKIKQGDEEMNVILEGEKAPYTGEKIIISIQYCSSGTYTKQYDDLRKQLLGSYSNLEIYGAEYPLPAVKKILSK